MTEQAPGKNAPSEDKTSPPCLSLSSPYRCQNQERKYKESGDSVVKHHGEILVVRLSIQSPTGRPANTVPDDWTVPNHRPCSFGHKNSIVAAFIPNTRFGQAAEEIRSLNNVLVQCALIL